MELGYTERKINSIQLLRAFAAAGIFLFHFFEKNEGVIAFDAGVEVFFCISGYLAMKSSVHSGKVDFSFISKRLLKVLPLYWVLTIVTYFGLKFFPDIANQGNVGIVQFILSMLLIPYQRSSIKSVTTVRPIVGPAWTLYYNVFFILIFYICSKLAYKYRGQICIGILCLFSVLSNTEYATINACVRILFSNRWFAFGCGIIVWFCQNNLNMDFIRKNRVLHALLIFIDSIVLFTESTNIVKRAVASGILLLLVIILENSIQLQNSILNTGFKAISRFGDISYSFYLLHYYVILATRYIISFLNIVMPLVTECLIDFALSVSIAFCVDYFFQNRLCLIRDLCCGRKEGYKNNSK